MTLIRQLFLSCAGQKLTVNIELKVAVIDMGTNTFHLVIASIRSGGYDLIHRERRAVKIGEKGINEGYITNEAAKRAIATMQEFRQIIDSQQVNSIHATATSAFRNAKNGTELAKRIYDQVGIEPIIISGSEEAELIYEGVRTALDIGGDPALIMDIGGGSIEFIIANRDKIFWKESFEIGGQRLLEKFHQQDPISSEEQEQLLSYLESTLTNLLENAGRYEPTVLIGSSGTFETVSDIFMASGSTEKSTSDTEPLLTMEGFYAIHRDLISKDRSNRLAIPGMIEMRVDMIVVASILITFVLEKLRLKDIRVSSHALKEGLLHQTINSSRTTP